SPTLKPYFVRSVRRTRPAPAGTITSTESALFCALVATIQTCPDAAAVMRPAASTLAIAGPRETNVTAGSVVVTAPLDARVVTTPGVIDDPMARRLTLVAEVPNVLTLCGATVSVTVSDAVELAPSPATTTTAAYVPRAKVADVTVRRSVAGAL